MARVKLEDLVLDDDETDDASASKEAADQPFSAPEAVTVTNLDDTDTAENPPEAPRKTVSPPKRRRSRTTGDRPALATVYTASETFRQLRNHVQARKAKGEIVSYGVVTLLAVQEKKKRSRSVGEGSQPPRPPTPAAICSESPSAGPRPRKCPGSCTVPAQPRWRSWTTWPTSGVHPAARCLSRKP